MGQSESKPVTPPPVITPTRTPSPPLPPPQKLWFEENEDRIRAERRQVNQADIRHSEVRLNIQRFSDFGPYTMKCGSDLPIEDLRKSIMEGYNLAENTELDIYQDFKKVQTGEKVVTGIDFQDESANLFVCVVNSTRCLHPSFVTNLRDMTSQSESDNRCLMPCGHAITPDNLYRYCWSKLEQSMIEIRCPALDGNDKVMCNASWTFADILRGACLSPDEINLFALYLNQNWLKKNGNIQLCPKCGEAFERNSNKSFIKCVYCQFEFCFKCLQEWCPSTNRLSCGNPECERNVQSLREVVQNSRRKTIVGVPRCPCIRACPNCQYVLEHEGDVCKHMDCVSCKIRFCFICLKVKTDLYWSCGGAFEPCRVAPIQLI